MEFNLNKKKIEFDEKKSLQSNNLFFSRQKTIDNTMKKININKIKTNPNKKQMIKSKTLSEVQDIHIIIEMYTELQNPNNKIRKDQSIGNHKLKSRILNQKSKNLRKLKSLAIDSKKELDNSFESSYSISIEECKDSRFENGSELDSKKPSKMNSRNSINTNELNISRSSKEGEKSNRSTKSKKINNGLQFKNYEQNQSYCEDNGTNLIVFDKYIKGEQVINKKRRRGSFDIAEKRRNSFHLSLAKFNNQKDNIANYSQDEISVNSDEQDKEEESKIAADFQKNRKGSKPDYHNIYDKYFKSRDFYTNKSDDKPLFLNKETSFAMELKSLNKANELMSDTLLKQLIHYIDNGVILKLDEIIEINTQFVRNKFIYNIIVTKIVNERPQIQIHNLLSQQLNYNFLIELSNDKNYYKQLQYMIDTIKQIAQKPQTDVNTLLIFFDNQNNTDQIVDVDPSTQLFKLFKMNIDNKNELKFRLELGSSMFSQQLSIVYENLTAFIKMSMLNPNLKYDEFNIEFFGEKSLQIVVIDKNSSIKRDEWTVLAFNKITMSWDAVLLQDCMQFNSEDQVQLLKLTNRAQKQCINSIDKHNTQNPKKMEYWLKLSQDIDTQVLNNFKVMSSTLQSSKILKFTLDTISFDDFFHPISQLFVDLYNQSPFSFKIYSEVIAKNFFNKIIQLPEYQQQIDCIYTFVYAFLEKLYANSFSAYESILLQAIMKFCPFVELKENMVNFIMLNYVNFQFFPKITVKENILKHKIFNQAFKINTSTEQKVKFYESLWTDVLEFSINKEKSFIVENLIVQGLEETKLFIGLQFVQQEQLSNSNQLNDPLQIVCSDPIGNQVLATLLISLKSKSADSQIYNSILNAIIFKIDMYYTNQLIKFNLRCTKNLWLKQCKDGYKVNPQTSYFIDQITTQQNGYFLQSNIEDKNLSIDSNMNMNLESNFTQMNSDQMY